MNERAIRAGYENFDSLYQAWIAGTAKDMEPMDELCQHFQMGMWNLLLAFKPDIVIWGGGLMENYYFLAADLLHRLVEGRADFLENFEILPAGKRGSSALAGASMLIFSNQ